MNSHKNNNNNNSSELRTAELLLRVSCITEVIKLWKLLALRHAKNHFDSICELANATGHLQMSCQIQLFRHKEILLSFIHFS